MNDTFDYIAEANVTLSDKFYGAEVNRNFLINAMAATIDSIAVLDKIKKKMFYGKPANVPDGFKNNDCSNLYAWLSDETKDDDNSKVIIHGIIGKVTEAGELLELLLKSIAYGESFDKVNLLEEIGDSLWYDAVMLKACDKTFDEVQRMNIAKLRARFPDKFKEFEANNRDLFAERQILENHSK